MITIDTQMTEVEAYLKEATQISEKYKLPEVCTEVFLYAMLDNKNLSAYQHLIKLGVNIIGMKLDIAKQLNTKALPVKVRTIEYSNALTGLLFLNGTHTTGVKLLQTILINKNTAAARMLNERFISVDKFKNIVYNSSNN